MKVVGFFCRHTYYRLVCQRTEETEWVFRVIPFFIIKYIFLFPFPEYFFGPSYFDVKMANHVGSTQITCVAEANLHIRKLNMHGYNLMGKLVQIFPMARVLGKLQDICNLDLCS